MITDLPLTIDISLEHEDGVVRAQHWLRGFVSIRANEENFHVANTNNNGNNENSDKLKVELVGKEIAVAPHQGENSVDIFHEESTRRVMDPVLEVNRTYCFPFSIFTPGRIAPSMEYSNPKSSSSCRIEFRLVATFQQYKAERKVHIVGQTLSAKEYPATVVPSVVPVITTTTFSWKKMLETKPLHRKQPSSEVQHHHGCLVWAAHVKNTNVGKGEDATFSFSLRNHSCYDVVKLSAKLMEKVSWKTHTEETHSHAAELSYVVMPNVSFFNNQKATLSLRQSQVAPIDHKLEQEMEAELAMKENTVTYQVPAKCLDSYKGKLIQVTHHLLIEARTCDTNGKNHTATMSMSIPLKVFDPPVVEGHTKHQHILIPGDSQEKWPADQDMCHASLASLDSWDSASKMIQEVDTE